MNKKAMSAVGVAALVLLVLGFVWHDSQPCTLVGVEVAGVKLGYTKRCPSIRSLNIQSAVYGRGNRRTVSVRDSVISACAGKRVCAFRVGNYLNGGRDPYPGVEKSLSVTYDCDGELFKPEAFSEGSTAELRCQPL